MSEDKRLIEDYLPIQAISKEASREKGVRKGHISTLHLWWARRPLVACRAAVYGALVPADRWVKDVDLKNPPADAAKAEAMKNGAKKGLNRRAAGEFVTALCKYPGDPRVIEKAQGHILDAHAERLTAELAEGRKTDRMPAWVEEFKFKGDKVTRQDIEAGRAPRPRVLDMFAGGGAIPLEALRLGCEAYALDLNPVAHIIELCTLVYPQKYGRPDPTARGMTGPKNAKGETTWGGLAEEVRYWGNWVLAKVRAEIGDLYPPIPDPAFKGKRPEIVFDRKTGHWVAKDIRTREAAEAGFLREKTARTLPLGHLAPVAYIWARTVRCKRSDCSARVPLFGQLWLRKKSGRCVYLRLEKGPAPREVRFAVCEGLSPTDTDVASGHEMRNTSTVCPACQTALDGEYIRSYGASHGYGAQLMAVVCKGKSGRGKVYLPATTVSEQVGLTQQRAESALGGLCARMNTSALDAEILPTGNAGYATGKSYLHGVRVFRQAFSPRQLATLLTFSCSVNATRELVEAHVSTHDCGLAVFSYLCLFLSQTVNRYCALTRWNNVAESVADFSSMKRFAISWDWPEINPWATGSGNFADYLYRMCEVIDVLPETSPADVRRGSATEGVGPWPAFDAVVTDPPYYDNESYAELSDMFYVWLRMTAGGVYAEHFATANTPKKKEVIAAAYRQGGTKDLADQAYLKGFEQSSRIASRFLKARGVIALVYAHKTTSGWSTMIGAVRRAGFQICEAWPLDTEKKGRAAHQDDAALASSIFLAARKREADSGTGSYETDVRRELEEIVRERVKTLWEMGISGADLVIACVGAGLRAFTRYARVEFANGEEVPAERFLAEVETVVLETILARLSKEVGGNGSRAHGLGGVDPATRFYVLWRYTYRLSELDAGEAIIFANGTHVELDGPHGLSSGGRPLVEKKKSKYRLLDYTERGDDERLGMPAENGEAAPLVDALHRVLWLMDHRPAQLEEFFRDARPNLEQVRLVAQALAGPALKGGELGEVSPSKELAALKILTSNWRSIAEAAKPLFDGKG